MIQVRFWLVLVFVNLVLVSCKFDVKDHKSTIYILNSEDSTKLMVCKLMIFRKGECVLDTNANIDGEFSFSEPVERIALRSAACYPKYIYADDLDKDSIFYMERSEIMIESGGFGSDAIMDELFKEIEHDVIKWNKDNCSQMLRQ